jgi:CubicO group peptidase (beta-lactamase class C family)
MQGVAVQGDVAPGFEAVRDAFAENFERRGERGAATAAVVDGRPVVDLWGGTADDAGTPWARDTIVHLYSVTKPFVATCALVLVDRGRVALDDPVAAIWPAFAKAGKRDVTLRHLLAHQAGLLTLTGIHEPAVLLDWERTTALLAAERPAWEPGSRAGEHALFFGHLVGEVVRRVDGRTVGAVLRDEVAGPWGLDVHVGLTADEQARTATLIDPGGAWRTRMRGAPAALYRRALTNPPGLLEVDVVNSAAWRAAEIPAVNGHGTARGVAAFYGALAAGGVLGETRLLSSSLLDEALRTQAEGVDALLERPVRWGLGFQLEDDGFGLGGIGGSVGWGDRAARTGFAYVTRRMGDHDRADAVEQSFADALRVTRP